MEEPFPPRSAEHYRQMAAQLRALAETEPEDSEMLGKLRYLADQYDVLAERARTGGARQAEELAASDPAEPPADRQALA